MEGEGGKVRFPPFSLLTSHFPLPQMAVDGVLCDGLNSAIPTWTAALGLGVVGFKKGGHGLCEVVLQAGAATETHRLSDGVAFGRGKCARGISAADGGAGLCTCRAARVA